METMSRPFGVSFEYKRKINFHEGLKNGKHNKTGFHKKVKIKF